MKAKKAVLCFFALVLLFPELASAQGAMRDTDRFSYGLKRVLFSPFRIPYHTARETFRGPFVIGTLSGVVSGTAATVGDLAGGTFDMAASAAPYAKYAIFFV